MRWMLLLLALPMAALAAVYKCPGDGGRVMFSDRPCAGAVESEQHKIEVAAPPAPSAVRQASADAKRAADWEEARSFYYVEIPQLERQAAELMASPDPARQAIGREMAWKAQQGREAFKELERAHKRSEETKRRYGDALRQFGGY